MHIETIDPGFGHWFAGFVDGEGSFTIPRRVRKQWIGYACEFSIALRDDDRAILETIHGTLGVGTLSTKPAATVGNNGRPQFRLVVGGKRDCASIVSVLDLYPLRAKKAADYAIWRQAVSEWGQIQSGRWAVNDWSRMADLRDALMTGRRYTAPTPQ